MGKSKAQVGQRPEKADSSGDWSTCPVLGLLYFFCKYRLIGGLYFKYTCIQAFTWVFTVGTDRMALGPKQLAHWISSNHGRCEARDEVIKTESRIYMPRTSTKELRRSRHNHCAGERWGSTKAQRTYSLVCMIDMHKVHH